LEYPGRLKVPMTYFLKENQFFDGIGRVKGWEQEGHLAKQEEEMRCINKEGKHEGKSG